MKVNFIAWLCCLSSLSGFTQNQVDVSSLPVNTVASGNDTSKPLALYITGDGGWNKFSQALTTELAKNGYPVVSLNANKYFWQKKTPEQMAAAMEALIRTYQKQWNRKKVLLVGYSFGADVMPFAYYHLSKDLARQVQNITLLSPSSTTDFEIHVMDMLGGKGRGESVSAAINKVNDKPIVIISGEGETGYKNGELTGKNLTMVKLAGGHHYDGDEASVANTIIQNIPKR